MPGDLVNGAVISASDRAFFPRSLTDLTQLLNLTAVRDRVTRYLMVSGAGHARRVVLYHSCASDLMHGGLIPDILRLVTLIVIRCRVGHLILSQDHRCRISRLLILLLQRSHCHAERV